MRIVARPLDATAFAPFGVVTPCPAPAERTLIVPVGGGVDLRPGVARAGLSWFVVPGSSWPITALVMERHRFSSQSFLPSGPTQWLILVAPHTADGGPDMTRAAAFTATGAQAITYHPDTWHHPLTAIGPAAFAVQTFLAGTPDDEEFRDLAQPVEIYEGG